MEPHPLPEIDFSRVGPPAGRRLPDIRLPNQHGTEVDVHRARRGRPALVVFYRSAEW